MQNLTLYIGDKNISSWSLRAYLMISKTNMPFSEVLIRLNQPDTQKNILRISPSGKIPTLHHNELIIWDSLAIGEYLAETFPEKNLWPSDRNQRALARSISAEMHSGFQALRKNLPFDAPGDFPNHIISDDAAVDISRVISIWENCLATHQTQGPFLFGEFTIADAMFAPVVYRFKKYHVAVSKVAQRYMDAIWDYGAMREWCLG